MTLLEGVSISPGYARGVAVVYDYEIGRKLDVPSRDVLSTEVESEWTRLDAALEESRRDLHLVEQTAKKGAGRIESVALLSAHAAMTSEIAEMVKKHIGRELVNVEEALDAVICDWVGRLQRLDNEYLRQREQDVRDSGRRMMRYLAGSLPWSKGPLLPGSIVVARELLPSEAMEFANCGIAAIVSERGGKHSHTAILARSLGIPFVSRILHATSRIHPGMQLLIDGERGCVTVTPSASDEKSFAQGKQNYENLVASSTGKEKETCTTEDGVEILLLANIGLPVEVDAVVESNLAGVGLFRTEFLFLESVERPGTQTQQETYGDVARGLGGLPLTIRTFDLGGDKLPPFLLSDEARLHGSLHLRGLRFSLAERDLLDAQLRAILHVSQSSDVRILFPMIIGSDDLINAIAAVDRAVDCFDLLQAPLIGAMIETPAALYALDEILDLADFVAIGTNDLTQYMLATEWELTGAEDDCTAMHPAVIKAIKQIVDAGEKHQCPVCVCGEEAGDVDFACLLVGLGIRELSLSPGREAPIRKAIRQLDSQQAREIAAQALLCQSTNEVRRLLAPWRPNRASEEAYVHIAPAGVDGNVQ